MFDAVQDWTGWIKEGHFLSYKLGFIKKYFYVEAVEFAHIEYEWAEEIDATTASGPYSMNDLEITRLSDPEAKGHYGLLGQIWQIIFGIRTQVLIYVQLPTDVERHGVPKRPKATSAFRNVGHYRKWMSPWYAPSFITEHFLIREFSPLISLSAYNPQVIALTPEINFFIAKLAVEKIGEYNPEMSRDTPGWPLKPVKPEYMETLRKLDSKIKPCRPITVLAVKSPATAT